MEPLPSHNDDIASSATTIPPCYDEDIPLVQNLRCAPCHSRSFGNGNCNSSTKQRYIRLTSGSCPSETTARNKICIDTSLSQLSLSILPNAPTVRHNSHEVSRTTSTRINTGPSQSVRGKRKGGPQASGQRKKRNRGGGGRRGRGPDKGRTSDGCVVITPGTTVNAQTKQQRLGHVQNRIVKALESGQATMTPITELSKLAGHGDNADVIDLMNVEKDNATDGFTLPPIDTSRLDNQATCGGHNDHIAGETSNDAMDKGHGSFTAANTEGEGSAEMMGFAEEEIENRKVREYGADGKSCCDSLAQKHISLKRRYRHVLRGLLRLHSESKDTDEIYKTGQAVEREEAELSREDGKIYDIGVQLSKPARYDAVYLCKMAGALTVLGVDRQWNCEKMNEDSPDPGSGKGIYEKCIKDALEFIDHVLRIDDEVEECQDCVKKVLKDVVLNVLDEVLRNVGELGGDEFEKWCAGMVEMVTGQVKKWFEEIVEGKVGLGWSEVMMKELVVALDKKIDQSKGGELLKGQMVECMREILQSISQYYLECEQGKKDGCTRWFARSCEVSVSIATWMGGALSKMNDKEVLVLGRHNGLLLHVMVKHQLHTQADCGGGFTVEQSMKNK